MRRVAVCVVWAGLVFGILGMMSGEASAAVPGQAAIGGQTSGHFCGYPWLSRGADQRTIPYFAAHPPVYYSHIVSRPYGYSPHAYVPGAVTPDFELSSPWHPAQPWHPVWDGNEWRWEPNLSAGSAPEYGIHSRREGGIPPAKAVRVAPKSATIQNPYVTNPVAANSATDTVSPKSLTIRNPFCVPSNSLGVR